VLVSAPAGVLGLVQEKAAELTCLLREGEDRRDPEGYARRGERGSLRA